MSVLGGRNSKMVVETLYTISLQKIFSLLESGIWDSCDINPFSFYPTKVVEDLLTIAYSDAKSMHSISLLLTSGRIDFFHLRKVNYWIQKHLGVLLKMMSEDICRNVRKLSVPTLTSDDSFLLETILQRCPNLEDVDSVVLFDLNALTGCKQIRQLRFHVETTKAYDFTCRSDFSVVQSLKNLEVFAFCDGSIKCYVDPEAVYKILINGPQITSVGMVDSLMAFAHVLDKESDPPRHFQLRKCLWGNSEWHAGNFRYLNQYKENYPEYVRNAISFCPLVEDLVLLVFNKDCLQHLSNLQHLSFLVLDFHQYRYDDDDYIPDIISLLKKIGPQLKHFSVKFNSTVYLDVIFDLCPNLESLQLETPRITENSEPSQVLRQLKRFTCSHIDTETLMYFLSNCRDLTEFHLGTAECLEDGILMSILKQNPLSKLKKLVISKCSLSKDGLRSLLLKVPSLERVYIYKKQQEVRDLIDELNLGIEKLAILQVVFDFFAEKQYTCTF